MIVDLRLLHLHPAQERIMRERKRFNVLKCGRRFGKTTICEELIADKIVKGLPIAYYSPTYKDLFNVWERIKHVLNPIIIKKDETVKQLKVLGGGTLDMWSMEDPDSGRGRKYARVIIDEAEKARHLQQAWQATIRATLADYKGDCWFLSTPRFGSTYFKKLAKMEGEDWQSWTFTTYDNPFIDPAEIDSAKEQLDEATFRCEFLAEDVTLSVNKFIFKFDRNKHIAKGLQAIPNLPVILSFDFNVEPITCLVGQVDGMQKARFLDEYRLMNSDIYELCERIKIDYPDKMLLVTGDASGQARTALKRELNYYKVIKEVLRLGMGQFKIPAGNPRHKNLRVLANSLLERHTDYLFSDRVPYLITDIEEIEVDENGSIAEHKDTHKGHLFMAWMYLNWNFLNKFLDLRIYDNSADIYGRRDTGNV
jgi:hypothetical protein